MKQRIKTAIIILLVAVPTVLFSKYIVYPILLALLAMRAVFELLRVIGVERKLFIGIPAYILAAAFPLGAYFVTEATVITYLIILAASLFVYMLVLMGISVFSKGSTPFSKISEIFTAITYIIVSFSSLSLARYLDRKIGLYIVIMVFVASWMCDVGAYLVGSVCGKHKLIPEISPKKTVEGAVGGIIIATAAFLLYGFIIDSFIDGISVNYVRLAVFGVLLSIVSQLGDLVASLIKREYGVKDYGRIFPGHGGVMDRFDSIFAVSTILMMLSVVLPPFTL